MGIRFIVTVMLTLTLVANNAWQVKAFETRDFLSCRDDERLKVRTHITYVIHKCMHA